MTRPHADLVALDELVTRLVRAVRKPAYHARVLDGVTGLTSIGGLRLLRVVELLRLAGRQPSIRDVATDIGIEHSTASRAVTGMVEAGLLSRTVAEDDQRRTVLDLTDDGRVAADRATGNRLAVLAEMTQGWSDADLHRLEELLARLVEGFDEL